MNAALVLTLLALPAFAEERTYSFRHTPNDQDRQEIATILRAITDLPISALPNGSLTLSGAAPQLALADWLFAELDRQHQPQSTVRRFVMTDSPDPTVRIYQLTQPQSTQQLQELATMVRALSEVRRLFTFSSPRMIITRGTGDQIGLTDWLLREVEQPSANSSYTIPNNPEGFTRIFRLPQIDSPQSLMELATAIRATAEIRRLFTYQPARLIALRGQQDLVQLSAWLVTELQRSARPTGPAPEYRLPNLDDGIVRVFWLPASFTPQNLQQTAVTIRTTSKVRRLFTYNPPRIIIARGTIEQMETATRLAAEANQPPAE